MKYYGTLPHNDSKRYCLCLSSGSRKTRTTIPPLFCRRSILPVCVLGRAVGSYYRHVIPIYPVKNNAPVYSHPKFPTPADAWCGAASKIDRDSREWSRCTNARKTYPLPCTSRTTDLVCTGVCCQDRDEVRSLGSSGRPASIRLAIVKFWESYLSSEGRISPLRVTF